MQLAQDISSRMYSKNVGVAGYGEAFDMHNRRNRQVKMRQLFSTVLSITGRAFPRSACYSTMRFLHLGVLWSTVP